MRILSKWNKKSWTLRKPKEQLKNWKTWPNKKKNERRFRSERIGKKDTNKPRASGLHACEEGCQRREWPAKVQKSRNTCQMTSAQAVNGRLRDGLTVWLVEHLCTYIIIYSCVSRSLTSQYLLHHDSWILTCTRSLCTTWESLLLSVEVSCNSRQNSEVARQRSVFSAPAVYSVLAKNYRESYR